MDNAATRGPSKVKQDSALKEDRIVHSTPAPVAQRIEQRFPKPCVGRSSRPRGTTFINKPLNLNTALLEKIDAVFCYYGLK